MKPWRRSRGLTLIEVVASLFLVGTLLVAVMAAHSRSAHQARAAQRQIAAVAALDEFLTLRASGQIPEYTNPSGKLPGESPLHWRSELVRESGAEQLGAVVERVELYDPDYDNGRTLASVELLQPGE